MLSFYLFKNLNLYQRARKSKNNAKTSKILFSKNLNEPLEPQAYIVHSADLDIINLYKKKTKKTIMPFVRAINLAPVARSKPKPPDAASDRITLDF